jgi:hypothetical protein
VTKPHPFGLQVVSTAVNLGSREKKIRLGNLSRWRLNLSSLSKVTAVRSNFPRLVNQTYLLCIAGMVGTPRGLAMGEAKHKPGQPEESSQPVLQSSPGLAPTTKL